jgi:hypothetical protein
MNVDVNNVDGMTNEIHHNNDTQVDIDSGVISSVFDMDINTVNNNSCNASKTNPTKSKPKTLMHPLKAPKRVTKAGVPICRFHNYRPEGCKKYVPHQSNGAIKTLPISISSSVTSNDAISIIKRVDEKSISPGTNKKPQNAQDICECDHDHCHFCGEFGHVALQCINTRPLI